MDRGGETKSVKRQNKTWWEEMKYSYREKKVGGRTNRLIIFFMYILYIYIFFCNKLNITFFPSDS